MRWYAAANDAQPASHAGCFGAVEEIRLLFPTSLPPTPTVVCLLVFPERKTECIFSPKQGYSIETRSLHTGDTASSSVSTRPRPASAPAPYFLLGRPFLLLDVGQEVMNHVMSVPHESKRCCVASVLVRCSSGCVHVSMRTSRRLWAWG